jgi:hypothetical protein
MDNNDIILEENGSVGLYTHTHTQARFVCVYIIVQLVGEEILLFSTVTRPALRQTQPPIAFWELFAKNKVARV